MNILKKFMNKITRLVANVIIKNGLVVQSFKYNNFLPIGKPEAIIKNLDRWNVDEIRIIVIDSYKNNNGPDYSLLKKIKSIKLKTPLIYSGGILSLNDALNTLALGADRICLESIIFDSFNELKKISNIIGAQSILISVPIINQSNRNYLYRYKTKEKIDIPISFNSILKNKLCSEIIVTDVLNQGSNGCFNLNILKNLNNLNTGIIASGGVNTLSSIKKTLKDKRVNAIAIGNCLNYQEHSIQYFKNLFKKNFRKSEYQQATYSSFYD